MGIPTTQGVDTIYVILSDKELKKVVMKGVIKGLAIVSIVTACARIVVKELNKKLKEESKKSEVEEVVENSEEE